MALSPRPATTLLAQELWDYAIDNVVDSDDSRCYLNLRTCSLVCRTLITHRAVRAQAYLFRQIKFWRPWACDHFVDAEKRTRYVHMLYDYVAGGSRLCTTLRSSPHLTPFIRRIDIQFPPGLIAQISTIGLSRVNTIHISASANYKGDIQDDTATSLLAELVAMPSVCEVHVNDSCSAIINLSHLFRAPSLTVISLHISFLDYSQNNPRTVDLDSRVQRIWIRELRLHWAKGAGAWLAHPDCPFDLSVLWLLI
jgi:hypothetical protein